MIRKVRTDYWWGYSWVLMLDDGSGCVDVQFDIWHNNGFINNLIVLEEYRKQGIGTMLVETAEEVIRNEGKPQSRLFAEKMSGREWIIEWYKRLGYRIDDIQDDCDSDNVIALVKDL